MKQNIVSFHGSPGSPKDFSLLEKELIGNWSHEDRHRESKLKPSELKGSILVGYSWGCRELLRALELNEVLPRLAVFISPYLFTSSAGGKEKFIFSGGKAGRFLYKKMGRKIVKGFLESSSDPQSPSADYAATSGFLQTYEVMAQAVLEKDELELDSCRKDIPILVVYSDADKTSVFSEQVSPLEAYFDKVDVERIPKRGHASVWNSPTEVASIVRKYI